MWLTSDGVRLAIQGYADDIRQDQDPPGARLSPPLPVHREGRALLRLPDLVENAELKGATPLMEFADDAAMTFNY
jgi:hypothetical protein